MNIYGQSKLQAEILVQQEYPQSLIIRTSAFFSPWDEYNFAYYIRKSLAQDEEITVANDITISPTYVPDLVNASLDVLIDRESGIWHMANKGAISWSDFAYEIADGFELDKTLIRAIPSSMMNYEAQRPGYSVLGSERGHLLRTFEQALDQYIHEEKIDKRKVA
jgi:dTDP-4-dehydrorhamnose reductase